MEPPSVSSPDGATAEEPAAEADACALVALPEACLFDVMSFLSAPDLARCQEVCRRWLALGRDDALWLPLVRSRPEFAAALARRGAGVPGAQPWHAFYRARSVALTRWRTAAPRAATLLAGLGGHAGTVFGVCCHPGDARAVLSAGEDARLRLWDAVSGDLLSAVDVPTLQGLFNVHAFAGEDARDEAGWAAACGFNGDVCLLPLRAAAAGGGRAAARAANVAALRQRLAEVGVAGEEAARTADALATALRAAEARAAAEDNAAAAGAVADADGDGGDDADTRPPAPPATPPLPAPAAPGVLLAGHAAPVVSARSRGDALATCSFDGTVRLWSVAAAADAAAAAEAAAAEAAAAREASDGTPARSAPRRAPPVFATSAALLSDVPGDAALGPHEYSVACVCLPAGSPAQLVRGGNDSLVKLWDVPTKSVVAAFAGHTGWIWCLEAADAAGSLVLTGATDSTLRGWDVRAPGGGAALRSEALRNAGPISGLAVRPQEWRVVTGSFDGQVRIFDLRMMSRGGTAPAPGGAAQSAQMGPPLRGHADRVSRVAATDAYAVSASFDGTLRVWHFDDAW